MMKCLIFRICRNFVVRVSGILENLVGSSVVNDPLMEILFVLNEFDYDLGIQTKVVELN